MWKYDELGGFGKVLFIIVGLFLMFAVYHIGTTFIQFLLWNYFDFAIAKHKIFIATLIWGMFQSLSGNHLFKN